MSRAAAQVVEQMLTSMRLMVRSYHPDVRNTGATLAELIPGTAFFPGGAGLWRGSQSFGSMPEHFPESAIMFVGHNFDSGRAHDVSKERGGEAQSVFWRNLLAYLSHAGVDPAQCFFSNALMGLKPGSALGPMPTTPGYRDECQAFLNEQIRIVKPSLVVALGGDASDRLMKLKLSVPCIRLLHPSARELKPLAARQREIERQGGALRDAYTAGRDLSPQ
ncbi:MAG: uracil-DNA glycosylase family protein [Terriglobia bacterium]